MATITSSLQTPLIKPPGPSRPGAPNRTLAQWAWAASNKLWAPFDFFGGVGAVLLAYSLAPYLRDPAITSRPFTAIILHAGVLVLTLYLWGLYERNILNQPGRMVMRAVLGAAAATLLTVGLFYLIYFQAIGRWVAGYLFAFTALAAILPRVFFWRIIRRRRRRLLFLGDSQLIRSTSQALAKEFSRLYKIIEVRQTPEIRGGTIEGAEDLLITCRDRGVDEIILPMETSNAEQTLGPALKCVFLGCQIRPVADLYEELFQRVPVSQEISLSWIFGSGWDSTNHFQRALKRLSDILLASLVLAVSLPFWIVIALLVKVLNPGPVFYSQTRVGLYGRPFKILKFRTMKVNAEKGKVVWSEENDPRSTGIGRLLRKTRLDELPQLLNILAGKMSFVGPRPERPEFTESLEKEIPFYAFRHLVRPGLTGWAQVNYGYGASVEETRKKLEYDLFYVRHLSFGMDLGIVLRTVTAFARGSR